MHKKWYIIILLALGLLTRFIFFGHPNETVFDEVHFGKFISGYYTQEYFFDIHPPAGKLAIAGFAKLFNFKPGFAFTDIGNKYPDNQHLILRFLPSLAGALLPVVIYLLLIEMGINRLASFFGGLLIVFENALLTQSHYILLDSFLLLFGFSALLFYFKSQKPWAPSHIMRWCPWFLFGFFSGLALSIKWTGLGFLALPLLIEFVKIVKEKDFKKFLTILLPPVAIALLVYSVIFLAHLIILDKSGPGDAFMSQGFQKTLAGNQYANNPNIKESNLFQKFTELNFEMYKANQRLGAHHSYSSSWYSWPLMTRPIYYWVKDNQRIYLIGNPIIWWASTVAVILLLLQIATSKWQKVKQFNLNNSPPTFLMAGYMINLLPFIGVKRIMFLYHYFTAYIFAIMALVWLISQTKNSEKIFRVLIVAAIASFIFFAPLSYGLELSPRAYELRVWLASWR
ncbi:MAG: phospholipid carrier-dependent glycosyltransferase [bacterium]|nr:phospholipid carrier-dependent glycosyltransferase [bacterium]